MGISLWNQTHRLHHFNYIIYYVISQDYWNDIGGSIKRRGSTRLRGKGVYWVRSLLSWPDITYMYMFLWKMLKKTLLVDKEKIPKNWYTHLVHWIKYIFQFQDYFLDPSALLEITESPFITIESFTMGTIFSKTL